MPPEVRKYYVVVASGIADRGEKFNAGCVRDPGVPSVRFIAAAVKGDTLRVATEWGGFVLRPQIDNFTVDPTGKPVSVSPGIPEWLRGLRLTSSHAAGTYFALKDLLLSFYRSEKGWPGSPLDLKAFATTNGIPFNPKDYRQLTLMPEVQSNRLRYSYRLGRLALNDVLDPPSANAGQLNAKDSAP